MPAYPKGLKEALTRWREHPAAMVRELFSVEPDPWQETVLEAFPHNPYVALQACKGPGKALSFQTLTPTPLGTRRWGDLQVGDEIFAEDGSPTKIVARYDQGKVPLWRVFFDDGSSAVACGEHQWKVRGHTERARKDFKSGKDPMWVTLTTKQIIKRGVRISNGKWQQRQFEIPLHGAARLPHRDQPLDPYLVGVWIGDGTRDIPGFCKPYPEVAQEIRRRGYEVSEHAQNGHYRILGIMDEFRQLECHPCLSYQKFIPDAYKYASIAQRTDLLCGLMDTDGCIGDDSHMEYDTTSERLANDVVWLVRSLGGNARVKDSIKKPTYTHAGEKLDGRPCYRVTIRVPFNPFRIPHKATRWVDPLRSKSTSRYLTRYIDRIEPADEDEAMCVEVAHPSHCYLANDFIVTHNTCVLAWLIWNFLLTRPQPKVACTSINGDNLRDNLWAELALWRGKAPMLQAMFEWTTTRLFNRDYPETWWASARTWPKTGDANSQANTLAGLHADYIMFVIDESGGVPDAVMVSAEAALSSCIEGHIVQAGNPTHLEGPLYRASKDRVENGGTWYVMEITGDPDDPMRSPRVSIEWARGQIRTYGRDNPWVCVNIFGRFPPSSINALIGEEEVTAAMKREYKPFQIGSVAKVLGVDVARQGDDASVIAPRHGPQMFRLKRYRNVQNGTMGASILNRAWEEFDADAAFVDATGGLGFTWIDCFSLLGKTAIPVQFSSTPLASDRYVNKRAEMYFRLVDWIKAGGALPPIECEGSPELLKALINTTYSFKNDKMILEDKDTIKGKIGYSPDEADACALTFAEEVSPKIQQRYAPRQRSAVGGNYDPFGEVNRIDVPMMGASSPYDPFRN